MDYHGSVSSSVVDLTQVSPTTPISCFDGLQNQNEAGVDCGVTSVCVHPCNENILAPLDFEPLPDVEIIGELNAGALEGGPTGEVDDAYINNFYTEAQIKAYGKGQGAVDCPTGAPPSPLFGAVPFEQPLIRCEEMGEKPLDLNAPNNNDYNPLPQPATPQDFPALDAWLSKSIQAPTLIPAPREFSNTGLTNAWLAKIQEYLGRLAPTAPLEARPPTYNWHHQRWDEFLPVWYVETVMAGARTNLGERNHLQLHKFQIGEFGPGGLYHLANGNAHIAPRFHPKLPVQKKENLWTWDGTFPLKLVMFRYGNPLTMRIHNGVPIGNVP